MTGVSEMTHRSLLLAVVLLLSAHSLHAKEIVIDRDDILITESVTVRSGTYRVRDSNGDGVLHVKADHVVLDFAGATLSGAPQEEAPNTFAGIGISITDSKQVTVRGARIRGFKTAIYARNCEALQIFDADLSGNFRQRLKSTPEREDQGDWLWPQKNDQNEWLENYGAAITLDRSKACTVARNRAREGQNGIVLSRTTDSLVYDNDMSYLSGWGLALWRSSRNEVSHNRFDYCVRGYSHGVYARGQDSSGILVFEQSSQNVFAFNSATHGGDGFFLNAGQETTERTGKGGSNDNLVYGNDFSHAVANGIEATFSIGNRFVANRLEECNYGVWAGYSSDSQFLSNEITRCLSAGIAIEHGNGHRIEGNTLGDNPIGIQLWWDNDADLLGSVFGKTRNTRSERYHILRNRFLDNRTAVQLETTGSVNITQNEFRGAAVLLEMGSSCALIDFRKNNVYGTPAAQLARSQAESIRPVRFGENFWSDRTTPPGKTLDQAVAIDFQQAGKKKQPPKVSGELDAFLPKGARRGLSTIFVHEWGPYDYRQPLILPQKLEAWSQGRFHLLGPEGGFQLLETTGDVAVTPTRGSLPAVLTVTASGPSTGLVPFRFEVLAGSERLSAEGLLFSTTWSVKFFHWEKDPRKDAGQWKKLLEGRPVKTLQTGALDFTWGMEAPAPGVLPERFGTLAECEIELREGRYEVRTISDDGVRVLVDGKVVLENWTLHPPTENRAMVQVAAGRHAVRIEHFELDGFAQLGLWIRPVE